MPTASGGARVASDVLVEPDFLTPLECAAHLRAIARFRLEHELPLIERRERSRSLLYRVIDGVHVARSLPGISSVAERVRRVIAGISPDHAHYVYDERAAVNVNIVPPGGSYRWHYDLSPYTAMLYLNTVTGGEIEMYPNYRLCVGPAASKLQRFVDRVAGDPRARELFGKKVAVRPAPGLLLVMRGDRCLHSVAPTAGAADRISMVMAFDRLGTKYVQRSRLNRFVYTTEPEDMKVDPNYMA